MKKCKYCMSDLGMNTKICLTCGRKQKEFPKWLIIVIVVVIVGIAIISGGFKNPVTVINFSNMTETEINTWCEENKIKCNIKKDYSNDIKEGDFIKQSIKENETIYEGYTINITFSLGQKPKDEKFSYTVDKSYLDSSGFAFYIEGTVTNKKDKEYSYVQIEFICYDKDGNNLGTALDNTNNLLGNETWKFKAMGMFTNQEVDHCDYKEVSGW